MAIPFLAPIGVFVGRILATTGRVAVRVAVRGAMQAASSAASAAAGGGVGGNLFGAIRVEVDEDKLQQELVDNGLLEVLAEEAKMILSRAEANAPSWVMENATSRVRVGVSSRGPFAQAIISGSGAIAAEYGGTRTEATHFMTRAALGG